MKSILLYLYVITFLSVQSGNDGLKYDKQTKLIKFKQDSFSCKSFIYTALITNRDYITYIFWKEEVYGSDYPTATLDAFPGYDSVDVNQYYYSNSFIRKYFDAEQRIPYAIQYSKWIIKNYMFNPRYLDYPVIGLSKKQAMKYCKWLSDRYNEYLLIKKGVFKFNINQINEDCFVTESYEAEMYMGLRGSNTNYKWEDGELFCSFRLPTKFELKSLSDSTNLLISQQSNKFLKPWQKALFKVKSKGIEVITPDYLDKPNILISTNDTALNLDSIKISEYALSEKTSNYLDAYKELGYEQKPDSSFRDSEGWILDKDSLGYMNYIVIGLDQESNPVQIDENGFNRIPSEKLNDAKLKVFRFAVTTK